MTQPTYDDGRPIPPNDWEGDDLTPGAFGSYVTCQDTAAGRALYYATWGEVDIDGRAIRAAIAPPDSDGVSFGQVALAVARLSGRQMVWSTRTVPDARAWLASGLGLCVDGYYGAIPAAYREQARADFNHAVFVPYYDPHRRAYRVLDPLNPDLSGYGRDVPADAFEPFVRSLSGLTAWIALEEPQPAAEGNPMMNLVPTTCRRVVDLAAGTVLERTPNGAPFTTLKRDVTLGLISATATHFFVADGDAGVYVERGAVKAVRTQDLNVGR